MTASAVDTVASENEGAEKETDEVFTTEGCQLRAATLFAKCCESCPRAHSWACLSRHTQSEQDAAEQHQRQCRQRRRPTTAEVRGGSVRGEGEEEPTQAAQISVGKRPISETEATADVSQGRRRRARQVEELAADEPTATEPSVKLEDSTADAMMSARRRAYEGKKRTPQQSAIEAHDQAYLHGDVRNIAAEQGTASASHATPSGMPVSRQWVHDKLGKVTDEQLKRMIVEMAEVNKRSWSGETIAAATSAPRGSVQQVMASLSRGELSESERAEFNILEFGDEDDPINPSWHSLQQAGVLDEIRKAKTRVYAEGSKPKIKTTLNHWLRYTATVARVSFLRPRVNDDADAFMTESLLRQGFVADLVRNGCNVDTAEGYASLFNGWHIDTMGYGLVASKSFDDEQYRRTNQGLRRLHPATRLERAGHQAELNEAVLRKELTEMMAIYDEPGAMTSDRWARIERELATGPDGSLDLGKTKALVYSALTELMTDGLLRPGEGVKKNGFIPQSDVSFDRDERGRVKSATVMITPIKQRGKHVENIQKKPVVIKADRGGMLRTAELLGILFHVAPCSEGAEETTPAIRFPVEKIKGLNRTQKKSLGNITMKKVMEWYHSKCEAAGVPDHKLFMPHSFRISGATMLFRMGVTEEEIKTMGRWASDCYRIYCRLSKERLLELSQKMGSSQSSQFVNGSRGFLDTLMHFEPVEKRPPDDDTGGATAAANGGEPISAESESGAESEESDCMSDDEFEKLCGTAEPTPPEVEKEPTLESLFDDDDDA